MRSQPDCSMEEEVYSRGMNQSGFATQEDLGITMDALYVKRIQLLQV